MSSLDNFFGIMVLGFYLKYAVLGIEMSSLVKSDPPHFNGLKKTKLEPKNGVSSSKNKETAGKYVSEPVCTYPLLNIRSSSIPKTVAFTVP